jgi:bifunctional DNase/RNase
MIQVKVTNVFLISEGRGLMILLRASSDDRVLPIVIGQLEAQSILFQINKIPFPRPLTHDLFKSVMDKLECNILRTEISDLIDETFYGKLIMEHGNDIMEFDSRPSDAIALAMRYDAPIFVHEKVMDKAGMVVTDETDEEFNLFTQNEDEPGHEMTTLEVLQRQLTIAIKEERYEDAARIRDEINKLDKSN